MRQMTNACITMLLLTTPVVAVQAQAADADKEMLADQVLIASGNDARVSAINRSYNLRETMSAGLARMLPKAQLAWKPVIDQAIEEELRLESRAIFEENRHLYATRFSVAELKDMLAFYRSPGGKALVAQTPSIIAEEAAFGQQLGIAAVERLTKAICAKEAC